jgi:hypothetical protein
VITLYALGTYTINVTVSNADNDWVGDEEWTTASANFTVVLGDEYLLIANEFDLIEAYCSANLSGHASRLILHELDQAEAKFQKAWFRYQMGEVPSAVVKDIVSQILTDNVGRVVDHFNDKSLIGDAEAAYLAEHLLLLRNQLALFAGFMVGTESSRQLALANNAANNLAVYIENELPGSLCAFFLERELRALAYSLDGIILLDALHHPLGWAVTRALNEVDCLRHQISLMASRGTITVDQQAVLTEGLDLTADYLNAAMTSCPKPSHPHHHCWWHRLPFGFHSGGYHLLPSGTACLVSPPAWLDMWNIVGFP